MVPLIRSGSAAGENRVQPLDSSIAQKEARVLAQERLNRERRDENGEEGDCPHPFFESSARPVAQFDLANVFDIDRTVG